MPPLGQDAASVHPVVGAAESLIRRARRPALPRHDDPSEASERLVNTRVLTWSVWDMGCESALLVPSPETATLLGPLTALSRQSGGDGERLPCAPEELH